MKNSKNISIFVLSFMFCFSSFAMDNKSGVNTEESGLKKFVVEYTKSFTLSVENFDRVVALYNASPEKFLALSASEQQVFAQSAEVLKSHLTGLNNDESRKWSQKVSLTKQVFTILWSQSNVAPERFASED